MANCKINLNGFHSRLAEQYGMSCVTKLCFADFFKEHCANRENNRLLGNMQALEVNSSDYLVNYYVFYFYRLF